MPEYEKISGAPGESGSDAPGDVTVGGATSGAETGAGGSGIVLPPGGQSGAPASVGGTSSGVSGAPANPSGGAAPEPEPGVGGAAGVPDSGMGGIPGMGGMQGVDGSDTTACGPIMFDPYITGFEDVSGQDTFPISSYQLGVLFSYDDSVALTSLGVTADAFIGAQALLFEARDVDTVVGFGIALLDCETPGIDASPFDGLTFWAKAEVPTEFDLQILTLDGGPGADPEDCTDTTCPAYVVSSLLVGSEWEFFQLHWQAFIGEPEEVNPSRLLSIGFSFLGDTQMTIDELTFL